MLGVARLGAQRLELGEERPVLALELCNFVRQRRVESHSLRTRLRPWPYERRLLLNHATRYASFEPPCAAKPRRWFSESSGQRGANSAARCRMPRGSR